MLKEMDYTETLKRPDIMELSSIYSDTAKFGLVQELLEAYMQQDNDRIKELRNQLRTEDELFQDLMEKLKGKSVEKTIKKIDNGTASLYEALKGLFSLGTHISIECEKGNTEYRVLLRKLYIQLGDLIKRC